MNVRNHVVVAGLTAALSLAALAPVAYATPQSELAAASAQLEEYGDQLATYQSKLEEQTKALEDTSYKIGEKESQIKDTQVELDEAKTILGNRMRSSYKTGSSSLLEVFLGATSIDDIVSRIYYMDKIATNDAESIQAVRTLEERLAGERADLEETKAKQQKAVDELQVQVNEYTDKVTEARAYYDSLDAQIQQQIAEQQAAEENARIQAALQAAAEQEAQEQQTQPEQQQENNAATQDETQNENTNTNTNTNTLTNSSSSSSSSSSSATFGGGGVSSAYSCIGKPYGWATMGPDSFDCSGLVCYCYGTGRGRSTFEMINSFQSGGGWKTSIDQLSPGDLVFTSPGHVGIYLGNGMMIHAPHEGATVTEAPVYAFYGGGTY